ESIGTPSIWTVHAPQCPSLQAIFVPVRPSSSRSTWASDAPTRAPASSYRWPLTVSARSLTARHRQDVGEMDQPVARARDQARVVFAPRLRQRTPEVARRREQLADLREILVMPVAAVLVRRVEREPERSEQVLLPRKERRHRHREVLVDARERH